MKLDEKELILLQVERACSDLRRGAPVIIKSGKNSIFITSPDNLDFIHKLDKKNLKNKHLLVSTTRANYLFPNKQINSPLSIKIDNMTAKDVHSLALESKCDTNVSYESCEDASEIGKYALKLSKIAELIPALIIFETTGYTGSDFLEISTKAIDSYKQSSAYSMHEACRTPLTLEHSDDAEIIAYRPNVGSPEHYAIVIGKPSDIPLVRIHSSCYTGDLLASLDCDCRDQLQAAIELMSKNGGGVVLYLMQEGRGIGLVNKLRTYSLQDKGMDTVDANRALGFDDDERLFLPAAEILKKLNISRLKLLTNNPRKALGLEEYGIEIVERVPHIMPSNKHNANYLKTKASRLGHKF